MKASDLKSALDPHIKRASKATVKKVINNVKKNTKMKNMPPAKKENEKAPSNRSFDDLRDIVNIKKQKAVVNELDSLIHDQEIAKTKRVSSDGINVERQTKAPSPMETYLSQNPEKLKDMAIEDVVKLSMMTNSSGNGSNLGMMLAMGMNNNKNNEGNELTNKILGVMIEKMFNDNGGSKQQQPASNDKFMEYMIQQNLQNQQMLMKIMEKNNTPPVDTKSEFIREMFGLVKNQSDLENSLLREKLRDIEGRVQGTDSLGEAKRMIEFVNTFRNILGGGQETKESMAHSLKVKEMDFEQARQLKEEGVRDNRMNQIGSMINNSIETIGKVLGEPIAEAAKTKMEQFTENIKNPSPREDIAPPERKISPELLREEIDLGNLDDLEVELNELDLPTKPQDTLRSRFKVFSKGD